MMENDAITKEQAILLAGGTGMELARLLNISPQAIYMWPDGQPIPRLRQYELREALAEQRRRKRNGTN